MSKNEKYIIVRFILIGNILWRFVRCSHNNNSVLSKIKTVYVTEKIIGL